jgi:hypothetical protein
MADLQALSGRVPTAGALDHFVKMDGHWYFRQRKLTVDWIDNRPLGAD